MLDKKILGQKGENLAAKYYQKLGWHVLARNFYTRFGELDLVLEKNKKILIVEVKTRSSQKFGFGEESVSDKKINNIYIAYQILSQQKKLPTFFEIEVCVIYLCYNKYTVHRFSILT